jgi:HSP20 family molecular chaperone IbpA
MIRPQTRSTVHHALARVKIIAMGEKEVAKVINDTIARRAFQIFEARGSQPGHEADDWFRAESEIVKRLYCGVLSLDDKISVTTDLSGFDESGEVELFVAPRHILLRGREAAHTGGTSPDHDGSATPGHVVLRSLALGAAIDPARVTTRFNGCALEIMLPKVSPTRRALAQAA